MLYFSLVVSAVLLLIVNLIVWIAKEQPVLKVLATLVVFFVVCLGLLGIELPLVLLQAVLLGAIVSVWALKRWRPRAFLALSCTATLLAYGVFGVIAYQQISELQQEFPYVSMEDRLPAFKSHRPESPMPSAANDQLASIEKLLDEHSGISRFPNTSLRAIHEDAVRLFVNSPGFGVTRMIRPSALILKSRLRHEPPVPQPGSPSPSPWLLDSLQSLPNGSTDADNFHALHQESIVDFVNADNFGFMKDRRHVAGFQEHQISAAPTPAYHWMLQTLDLIGVALHEKPVAYVSEYLPRMDQLRTAPTRTLDGFEAAGLAELEQGEELFVRDRGEERRMVGALRAARQCVACHGCERGDLLGAFSYRLTQQRK